MKNIVLIGMPGCGKTTLGRLLAKRLNRNFVDIDEYIEFKANKSISKIFEQGEEVFRKIESECIKDTAKVENSVISTGGGAVKREQNIEVLKENGVIFFINRSLNNIIKDIDVKDRPLLKEGKERLNRLYEERIDLYHLYSDYEIINNCNIEKVMDDIINIIKCEGL